MNSVAPKPKTDGAAIKADADQSDSSNVVAPATGQKEAVPQWYDVDIVKGTQYTVTSYQMPVDGEVSKRERRCTSAVARISAMAHVCVAVIA